MLAPSAGTDDLATERLVLRRLRESDLDALAAIHSDAEVTRFLGGPRTRDDTRVRPGHDRPLLGSGPASPRTRASCPRSSGM
jgi:RimJ/RimL family protein N-acetyltransferase